MPDFLAAVSVNFEITIDKQTEKYHTILYKIKYYITYGTWSAKADTEKWGEIPQRRNGTVRCLVLFD